VSTLLLTLLAQRTRPTSYEVDSRVVRGLMEFGPRDIRKLSAVLGLPYNRVLASYKHMSKTLGLTVQAAPNTDVLGLTHVFFEATPTPRYRRVALQALKGVLSLNYLAEDACSASHVFGLLYVPMGARGDQYLELFGELVEEGFLESYSTIRFPKILRHSVRPEYVDWSSGEYIVDWDALTPRAPEPEVFDPSSKPLADRLDLLLLKELEFDASKSFPEIAENLHDRHGVKASDRLLLYHYDHHLVAKKMFSQYRVAFSQKEKLGVYIVAQIPPKALDDYLDYVRRVPHLNKELLDPSGNHFAGFYVTSAGYQGLLGYIHSRLAPLTSDMRIYLSLPAYRSMFTLPYELFDGERGEWMHDAHADARRVVAKAQELVCSA
jgi:hypothetical protein